MKVKIFSKSGSILSQESKVLANLEQEINSWLESNPDIKILDIKQSSCGGSLETAKHLITVWYETDV